jgi:RNA polymerase sigma factor (sigma-70 family)
MGLSAISPPPASVWTSVARHRPANVQPSTYEKWVDLVRRIERGEDEAMTELYRLFLQSVRYSLYRQMGAQDLEDTLHDSFLIVVQAIRRGDLREPERLMGFVRTIVRRQVAAHIDAVVQERSQRMPVDPATGLAAYDCNPEQALIRQQREEIAQGVLEAICERDRQILVRFYLLEQSPDEICDDMGLSRTQFRLMKSRAKARFGQIGRKRITHSPARATSAFRKSAA